MLIIPLPLPYPRPPPVCPCVCARVINPIITGVGKPASESRPSLSLSIRPESRTEQNRAEQSRPDPALPIVMIIFPWVYIIWRLCTYY
ncbi:hypothetical protein K504DRAFT_459803 [Pleomassaria siparia CBS 279.74]|uniref:Uncharacterized protein n=1 Tax=Pleomassaria siparia CBS 279.74 TaxID=1314801 RepID=A0A6G1JPZ7_9PLEO|nr:hypothetical protein K504DRAFT_459803 [Pleomassaria siparia CBS 279.74]